MEHIHDIENCSARWVFLLHNSKSSQQKVRLKKKNAII